MSSGVLCHFHCILSARFLSTDHVIRDIRDKNCGERQICQAWKKRFRNLPRRHSAKCIYIIYSAKVCGWIAWANHRKSYTEVFWVRVELIKPSSWISWISWILVELHRLSDSTGSCELRRRPRGINGSQVKASDRLRPTQTGREILDNFGWGLEIWIIRVRCELSIPRVPRGMPNWTNWLEPHERHWKTRWLVKRQPQPWWVSKLLIAVVCVVKLHMERPARS